MIVRVATAAGLTFAALSVLRAPSCDKVLTREQLCRAEPGLSFCASPAPPVTTVPGGPLPSTPPVTTPTPAASPSPAVTPEPSAPPTPVPPPASPAPTPEPPRPQACVPFPLPIAMRNPEVPAGAKCERGFTLVEGQGHRYCIAISDTTPIRDASGAIVACETAVGACPHVFEACLEPRHDCMHPTPQGFTENNGFYLDAYCRRGPAPGGNPFPGEAGTWVWSGWCAPRFCDVTPAPSPAPQPSPVPGQPGARCVLPIARLALGDFGVNGDRHNYQATYRFGNGNGKPCDGSHLACDDPNYHGEGQCEPCGGAVCEDPRGGDWSAGDGATVVSVSEGEEPYGYHATVRGPSGSWVKLCVPPSPRSRQGGVPLTVTKQCESVRIP